MQDDSFKPVVPSIQPLVGQLLDKLEAKGGEQAIDVDSAWSKFVRITREASSEGTKYVGSSGYDSASGSSQPIIRRIAGRVFPSLATGSDVGRGVFCEGALPHWMGYAAIAFFVAVSSVGLSSLNSIWPKLTQKPVKTVSYVTKPGERAVVSLFDGSSATLAPATTLKVSGRNIELSGEAMFAASHRSGAPFTVRTDNVVTKVLGTTFAVRKYPNEASTRVSVAEGRVAVSDKILSNGDVASALSDKNVIVAHDADLMLAALAFAQGKLVLDSQSLSDAVPQLARWFALDIRITRGVATRPFSITLQHESAQEALRVIARLTGTSFTSNGSIITFTAE